MSGLSSGPLKNNSPSIKVSVYDGCPIPHLLGLSIFDSLESEEYGLCPHCRQFDPLFSHALAPFDRSIKNPALDDGVSKDLKYLLHLGPLRGPLRGLFISIHSPSRAMSSLPSSEVGDDWDYQLSSHESPFWD